MSHATSSIISLPQIIQVLRTYRWRWIAPMMVITVVALGYACLRMADWEASQALLVRDEATGSLARPGRFDDSDSMKTAQEMVLQLAKSHAVIRAALVQVGPSGGRASRYWPTPLDIEKTQGALVVTAPNGAEFGSTEVFYVKVKDSDSQRAIALTKAICDQLEAHLKSLRDQRAMSLVEELNQSVKLAQADMDEATARLSKLEREVGVDLSELRILNESAAGQSNLRQSLIQIHSELRQAKDIQQSKRSLLATLLAAQNDVNQLIALPGELLNSQSALLQLKNALVVAQLKTATLLGDMSLLHPRVQAAQASQELIRKNLFGELETSVRSIRVEMQMSDARVQSLQQQSDEVQNRMNRLVSLRVGYNSLVAGVQQRSETLRTNQHNLSEAQASLASAQSVNLITRLDGPAMGNRPLGPRKAMIVLLGALGGLATGLGFVYLTVPQSQLFVEPKAVSAPVASERKTLELPAFGLSFKQALMRVTQGATV